MVKFSVGVIDQSGYVGEKVSFKSDQEPSMVALKHHTAASRVGQTVPIESPVRSSKSNGMMENAIKIWQGQLRTIKHHVETRTGACIEPGGVIFSWLIPYCADILNNFRVGADGRTAYERITSHACKVAQVGFGEVVDFKPETDKNNRLKADSEFFEGVCLGYAWRSTEYLVAVGDDIYTNVALLRGELMKYVMTGSSSMVLQFASRISFSKERSRLYTSMFPRPVGEIGREISQQRVPRSSLAGYI